MADIRVQRMLVGVFFIGGALFFAALFLCDLFPPPSPDRTPEQWKDFWTTNQDLKRLGLMCGLIGSGAVVAMPVLLFLQLKRVEGGSAPLAHFALAVGVVFVVPAVVLPWLFWSPLVYRDETLSPDLAQGLSDLGFFIFFMPWPFMVWMLTVATGVLRSSGGLPRWYAYLSLWIAAAAVPGGTIYFFKDGIFAWNGLMPFWLAVAALGVWVAATVVALLTTLSEQERSYSSLTPK